jgi:hypothetical protein
MQYLFHTAIPVPWLLADLLTLLLSLLLMVFVIQKSKHPVVVMLEAFCFVFLYASIFENFAVVQGWYVYGRSLLMIGDVPLSVPLIEMDVLVTGLWLLEKMHIPEWCKPFVVGLFGMLQDFSLDPIAVRQVYETQGVISGRWTWLIEKWMVNIYDIPVYNFPGWMLIMMYASIFLLLGRWWFKRSGYKPAVGYAYPFLMIFLALVAMVSPLSQFLLWLAPFGSKGSSAEWIMLAFHLLFPTILLTVFWRGKMKFALHWQADYSLLVIPALFHLSDILFTLAAGKYEVLWLVLLSSFVHVALLGGIFYAGFKTATVKKPVETGNMPLFFAPEGGSHQRSKKTG